jgi:Flp pilus assembly protein TadG
MWSKKLLHHARRLKADRSGATMVVFAFFALALLLMVGLAIDYANAFKRKQTLDTAADAAALAALAVAQADVNANASNAQMVQDATTAAQGAFVGNAGSLNALLTQPLSVSVQRNGQVITASANYLARSPNAFGALANVAGANLSGGSTSSVTLPNYLSFYLLLDVSGSMGIPSTNSEQSRLAAINPDFLNLYPGGCTIACHFNATKFPAACQNSAGASVPCQGFNLSRTAGGAGGPVAMCPQPGQSNCIQLRLDAVAYAVQQLALTASQIQTAENKTDLFGFGIYPFAAQLATFQTLTYNAATVAANAPNLTGLIDSGGTDSIGPYGQSVGSGGTHFENALTGINTIVANVGNGSSLAAPIPFVFMVTDGAQDPQYQVPTPNGDGTWSPGWSGSNHATTLDTTNCTLLKNRGITLAILEIPYVPIQNPTTIWNDEDDFANANAPLIPPVMQACASPGFYFQANAPADINNALQAMFAKAVAAAAPHLTK